MQVINVFGLGKPTYGKTSSSLNLHSEYIDRRKKENSSYRSGKVRKGQLVREEDGVYILFEDGERVKTDYDW